VNVARRRGAEWDDAVTTGRRRRRRLYLKWRGLRVFHILRNVSVRDALHVGATTVCGLRATPSAIFGGDVRVRAMAPVRTCRSCDRMKDATSML
jgi:hypothetical protein